MKLFEDKPRFFDKLDGFSSGRYSYLDASNRYVEENVRNILNGWYEKYPE